jgi:hypothetical protein
MDGFDEYNTAQMTRHWTDKPSANTSISSGNGRNGGNCLLINALAGSARYVGLTLAAASSWMASFAFRYGTAPSTLTDVILGFLDTATSHIELRLKPGGVLSLSRNGTELANSGAFAMSPATYYHVVVAATVADAPDGKYDVWVDGTKRLTGTGADTRNAGNASANVIRLGNYLTPAGDGANFDYDDLGVWSGPSYTDADYPGDCRVFTDLPTGDGNHTAWAASAGADYACVDENPATDDTDYISTSTANDIGTFTFPTISGSGTVRGVMGVVTDRMDDAGPRSIAVTARANATDVVGATQAVSATYVAHRQIFVDEPGGSGWAALSDVNAAELGVKLIA